MSAPKERELFTLYLDARGCLNVRVDMPDNLAGNFRDEAHMWSVYHALKTLQAFVGLVLSGIHDRMPPPPPKDAA